MEKFSFVIFVLTVLIFLSALIEKIKLPHPVFFLVAGLMMGFIPALPDLALDPDVIFVIFLPPLLYDAAFRTSWKDFKRDIRPISALAITLVFFTAITVAVTAHYFIPHFSWPLAFLLGAIIAPPDAAAAAGIIKGLGLNKRVIAILEGESLVNDASALIAYRYALTAVITGSFILWEASLRFLLVTGGGIAIGLLIGYVLVIAHKKINQNATVETSLTLLTPFLSYLAAEQFHASGILSVVSTGLFISWHSHEIFAYQTRMRARLVWNTLMFLLHGFVFILIGMQLPSILKQLADHTLTQLIFYGVVISVATIIVRVLWVFGATYSVKLFKRKEQTADSDRHADNTTWKNVLIISWTGTRGVISLAAALAIPLTLYNGTAFPQRPMILFLCFVVIFITLVVQGLTLQPIVRLLGVKPKRNEDRETRELQLYMVNCTLDFIDEAYTGGAGIFFRDELKKKYEKLAKELNMEIASQSDKKNANGDVPEKTVSSLQQARLEVGKFQRDLLLKLHKEGTFNSKAIHDVEKIMDVDELHFDQQMPAQKR